MFNAGPLPSGYYPPHNFFPMALTCRFTECDKDHTPNQPWKRDISLSVENTISEGERSEPERSPPRPFRAGALAEARSLRCCRP